MAMLRNKTAESYANAERPLHLVKSNTVGCHLCCSYHSSFSEKAQEERIIVNGVRYRAIFNDYFFPIVSGSNRTTLDGELFLELVLCEIL